MSQSTSFTFHLLVGTALLSLSVSPIQAQWLTQTNALRAGWNAVYLHVDPSHTSINELVEPGDPIEEIWLWNPELPPGQAVATPQFPLGTQWSGWNRNDREASVLQTLRGNAALLVRLEDRVPLFEWRVKGQPVAPVNRWTLTGLNFIGFPTAASSPTFESFLAPDAQLLDWGQGAEIFRYQGGILGATNPILVDPFFYRNTPVRRDQAYWVRAGDIYNRYFGPFQISGTGSQGIRFGDAAGQTRCFLKNVTGSELTITLQLLDSETSPAGQAVIAGKLPLLIRGPLNTTNLTFTYSDLSAESYQWTLAPYGQAGSEAEIILGVNRAQMSGAAGKTFAGVLRFTDSLGLSQVDVAASATTSSRTGLWVGRASVDAVSQYLKPYAEATNANHFHGILNRLNLTTGTNNPSGTKVLPYAQGPGGYLYQWNTNNGRILVFGGPNTNTGNYLIDGDIKLETNGVSRAFPLRLIVHSDGASARLLQRVYVGIGNDSNMVVSTQQRYLMPSQLATARRISSLHLPTTDGNLPSPFNGTMQEGETITATIHLSFNDHASNPFLHTYHPDHDNLDALFDQEESSGRESYDIDRAISLRFAGPVNDFDSLTRSSSNMRGNYAETITFRDANRDLKQFDVLGSFLLTRIIDIPTLRQ